MDVKTLHTVEAVFESWRNEDQELEQCIDSIRDWMQEVNQLGIQHFGETATRLRPVRERLATHFERENLMVNQLGKLYPASSPEIEAVRRQANHDHEQLLGRLDDLIGRLDEVDPPFQSWEAAMQEVELFVDVLEQHEEQEWESMDILLPSKYSENE